MRRLLCIVAAAGLAGPALAQTAWDWQQVEARFRVANPAIRAGMINIDESRAAEITIALAEPEPS